MLIARCRIERALKCRRVIRNARPMLRPGSVEADGRRFNAGQMLVFEKGGGATLTSVGPAIVMLLGGEPVG